jgi:putative nucleotidyltransferase with HDIG domain
VLANAENVCLDLFKGVKAVAGVPLIASRQLIGVLWVGRNRDWSDSELRILNAIADMAANAIHRTTLYEQTEHRLEQLQALQVVDQAITSSLDLRVILDILLEKVTTQLRVDAADILLFDASTEMLRFAARRGFQTQSTQRTFIRLGEGHAGRVVLEKQIIAIPDIRESDVQEISYRLMLSEGFVAYYGVPLTARGQVQGVLQIFHRSPFVAEPEWLDFLQALSGQAAVAIDNAMLFDGMRKANLDLRRAYDETIEGWALALEYRDQETEGHSRRVTELTVQLAERLGVEGEELLNIRRGAILHDVGKMGIPDNILQKPGPLTESEREIMKQHPVYAYKMLSSIDFLVSALDIPYCHHENWDGSGYPMGLKGEEIPLAARIFSIIDVWDALNFDRPYRPGWEKDRVIEYIRDLSGKQFDPRVAEAFFLMLDEAGLG